MARPFGESDLAYIRRQRLEGVPFDFPDVIIDGVLATLDVARRASDAQVAGLREALHDMIAATAFLVSCVRSGETLSPDDERLLAERYEKARAALAAAPAPQPAPPLDVDTVADWLDDRMHDRRLEDIFGLWVQGKRDSRWVAEKIIGEGHLARLAERAGDRP